MSSFSGLSVGLSSLYAQRRGLEVTGHNIANSNTEGYSRQRVRLEANAGPLTPALHSRWNGTGNGVTVADQQRLRDVFLEARALQERGADANLRGSQVVLSRVEAIMAEPSDSGLQSQLSDFWAGWDDVANQPTDLAARSQLLERAQTLAQGLNSAADRIGAQWSASYEQLDATVKDINAVAQSVADFNRAVSSAVKAELNPNDLADQRDLLVQKLGTLAGVTVRQGDSGAVDVYLGGTALVRGDAAERLVVQGDEELRTPTTAVTIGWEKDGHETPIGGAAGGLVNGLNVILPRYRTGLDDVASALAEKVNAVHQFGSDGPGGTTEAYDLTGTQGVAFFTGTTAGTIAVALSDPRRVAASTTGVGAGDRGGDNAAALAELATAKGGPDEVYRQLIVGLGVDAQAANRRVDIQANILSQVDAAREAESGVNLDEEMANMLAYQRAYEGAARFVSAVDQMLDTLINRTGLVGR